MSSIGGVGAADGMQQVREALLGLTPGQIEQMTAAQRTQAATLAVEMNLGVDVVDKFDRRVGATARRAAPSAAPATAGPRALYSHNAAQAGHSFAKVEKNLVVTLPNGATMSGKALMDSLEKGWSSKAPGKRAATEKFMRDNGIVRRGRSNYVVDEAKVTVGSVSGDTRSSSSGVKTAALVGAGALAVVSPIMGIPLFAGLCIASRASKGLGSASGAFTAGGGMGALTSLQGGIGGVYGALGGSTDGLEFKMRQRMASIAADQKSDQMISMINNESIPIEDLIFYFLAFVCEQYDEKLRNKMEEAALQEKIERRQERRKQDAEAAKAGGSMLGGLVSLIPGVGTVAGAIIKQGSSAAIDKAVNAANDVDASVNGTGKSSTLLNNEITVLMNKWKQATEMLSNMIKALHDMAMTPIRNMRG